MDLIKYLLLVSWMLYACGNGTKTNLNQKGTEEGIVGTWRIVEFSDFDTTQNVWVQPYGKNVKGYFTYTASNIVNLNIANEKSISLSRDSLDVVRYSYADVLNNFVGYFGEYTVDAQHSVVTHHVKGGAIPWYVGTDQPRPFVLNGDTLVIGDPASWKRVLVRVD